MLGTPVRGLSVERFLVVPQALWLNSLADVEFPAITVGSRKLGCSEVVVYVLLA